MLKLANKNIKILTVTIYSTVKHKHGKYIKKIKIPFP